jgi:hypothetical protein
MSVLLATATTATIACTDRVVILNMSIFVRSLSFKTKNPGFKARVRISFEQYQAFRDVFSPLPRLPEELLYSWL